MSAAAGPCPEVAEWCSQSPPDNSPSERGHLGGAQYQRMGLWLWLKLMLLLNEGKGAQAFNLLQVDFAVLSGGTDSLSS